MFPFYWKRASNRNEIHIALPNNILIYEDMVDAATAIGLIYYSNVLLSKITLSLLNASEATDVIINFMHM